MTLKSKYKESLYTNTASKNELCLFLLMKYHILFFTHDSLRFSSNEKLLEALGLIPSTENQAYWHTSVIPALKKWTHEHLKVIVIHVYINKYKVKLNNMKTYSYALKCLRDYNFATSKFPKILVSESKTL